MSSAEEVASGERLSTTFSPDRDFRVGSLNTPSLSRRDDALTVILKREMAQGHLPEGEKGHEWSTYGHLETFMMYGIRERLRDASPMASES